VHAIAAPRVNELQARWHFLLADLGVTKTHSRPHVSDTNPYSESQLRHHELPDGVPERFGCIQDRRAFAQVFFRWYNETTRHEGGLAHAYYGSTTTNPRSSFRTRPNQFSAPIAYHPERSSTKSQTTSGVPRGSGSTKPLKLK